MLGHGALHKNVWFRFQLRSFWGEIINSRALFCHVFFFFGQKHPRLIFPWHSTITGFCPQNGLCTAQSTGQDSGMRRGAARERNTVVYCNSGTGTVRTVRCNTGMIQRRYRYYLVLCTCTARQNLRIKYNKRYGHVAQCFADRLANYCALCVLLCPVTHF